MSSYFASFFGSAPAESEPTEEEARQRAAVRRKAAAEARRKREQGGSEEGEIAAFAVGGRTAPTAPSAVKAGARVVGSRPAKASADSLGAIAEEGASVASAKAWSAVTADPEDMKRLAARAQAAQEQAVADLMTQVREQHWYVNWGQQ